jgi:uncharacterized protein (DUF305 family)
MNRSIRSICVVLAAEVALGLAQAAPGNAQNAMKNTALDCSKADSRMALPQPDASMQAMKPTGNVDKDFAQTMMAHNGAMMEMAKAEVACGKDAKTKAMAQKAIDQLDANDRALRDIIKSFQNL